MSIFHYPLEITGPNSGEFRQVMALVDTGATFTQMPATLLRQLGVRPTQTVRFRLGDGSTIQRPIGETQVRIEGQTVNTVVVFGDDNADALLGVYTLERALLAVEPAGQRLIPTDALLV